MISVSTLLNPVKTATSATELWLVMKKREVALSKSLQLTVKTSTHVPLVSMTREEMFL